MEKSSKRGKIPQSDWPLIMVRYEKGETLASIARTYDCSPPAISYIVSRSKARQPAAENPQPAVEPQLIAAEPQLIKAHPELAAPLNGDGGADNRPAENGVAPSAASMPAPVVAPLRRDPVAGLNGNGFAADRNGLAASGNGVDRIPARPAPPRPAAGPQLQPPASGNGEQRRTLHLALGGNGANGANGANGTNGANGYGPAAAPMPPPAQAVERPEPRQPLPQRYGYPAGERAFGEQGRLDAEAGRRKDGGNFIDQELRARVDGDIAAFLSAFDAALADDTVESRAGLREATDRLLRAGARTRIELERLEARVPLSPRASERPEAHWRHR